jgi:hypothetical protein
MPVRRVKQPNKVVKPKRNRPVVNDARFDLLLPSELLDQLRAHAADTGTSAASIVRHLIDDFLGDLPGRRKTWP